MGLLSFIVFVLGFIVQLAKKTVGKEGGPGSNSQINIYLAWFEVTAAFKPAWAFLTHKKRQSTPKTACPFQRRNGLPDVSKNVLLCGGKT